MASLHPEASSQNQSPEALRSLLRVASWLSRTPEVVHPSTPHNPWLAQHLRESAINESIGQEALSQAVPPHRMIRGMTLATVRAIERVSLSIAADQPTQEAEGPTHQRRTAPRHLMHTAQSPQAMEDPPTVVLATVRSGALATQVLAMVGLATARSGDLATQVLCMEAHRR